MTPIPLSPETRAAIATAVDQITAEHGLPAETHAELAGHLEDKTLAYLSGEQPFSQSDALLLARNHLGNPKSLGLLLAKSSTARPALLPRPFAQRLAWAAVAFITATALTNVLHSTLFISGYLVPAVHANYAANTPFDTDSLKIGEIATMAVFLASFVTILWYIHRFFSQRPATRVSFYVAAALVLNLMAYSLPSLGSVNVQLYEMYALQGRPTLLSTTVDPALFTAWKATVCIVRILTLTLWFAWTCRKSPTIRNAFVSLIAWLVTSTVIVFTIGMMGGIQSYLIIKPSLENATGLQFDPQHSFFGYVLMCIGHNIAESSYKSFLLDLPTAIAIILILVAITRRRKAAAVA